MSVRFLLLRGALREPGVLFFLFSPAGSRASLGFVFFWPSSSWPQGPVFPGGVCRPWPGLPPRVRAPLPLSFFCLFLAEWAAAAGLSSPVSSPSCAPQRGPLPAARGRKLSPPSAACHLHVMVHGVLLLSGRHADLPSPPPLLLLLALWVCVWARPSPLFIPRLSACVRVLCHAQGGARAYLPATLLHAWSCLVSRRRR